MTKVMSHILRSANHRVQTFKNGKDFYQYQIPKQPCCLILDICLRDQPDGPTIFRQLLQDGACIPVIFLTNNESVRLAVDLIRAGALNFLCKSDVVRNRDLLLSAVNEALQVSANRNEEANRTARQKSLLTKLTPRESETLQWIITGMLNKQIAGSLKITERTVKAHRAAITEKTGLYSVAELVRFAESCGVHPAVNSSVKVNTPLLNEAQ